MLRFPLTFNNNKEDLGKMNSHNEEMDPIFEEFRQVLDSTSLVTARMIESITVNSQLASSYTPEMHDLFRSWLDLIAREILKNIDRAEDHSIDIADLSRSIGIEESTLLALLLYLYRKGNIQISKMVISRDSGENRELCHDLK